MASVCTFTESSDSSAATMSGVRSRARSMSPFSIISRWAAGSATWRTITRFTPGAPERKSSFAVIETSSLAFHDCSVNGPEPAELFFSQA